MKNEQLKELSQKSLPISIKRSIDEVLNEDEAYVADELVELSELILLELAALGFAAYLIQPKQKSVYNDFLLQLFTTNSHAYNAGPLFRWAANMIKDINTPETKVLYPLFWEANENTQQLNTQVHHLAHLRNEVMHGFFLLPPKRNREEASHIAQVISELKKSNVFSLFKDANFHFLKKEVGLISFSGRWGIEDEEWAQIGEFHTFGSLASKIRYQLSDSFDNDQKEWLFNNKSQLNIHKEIIDFIDKKKQGAFALWHRPNENVDQQVANLCMRLNSSERHFAQFIALDKEGLSFTSQFLLGKLVRSLAAQTGISKYSSDPKKAVKELINKCGKQPVVVIKDIHFSLFHTDHLLRLVDFLFEHNILLLAFGIHYTWMDQFFNNVKITEERSYVPDKNEWVQLLDNYLRFKGPNKEFDGDVKEYELLNQVIEKILNEINLGNLVIARKFADAYDYPMEYVHEGFAFLNPFLNSANLQFEEDELDEMYNFPKEINESSRLYFSIGRRDAQLEYQHKTLTL
ncbi:MAG: hypothetical protein ISP74_02955 [Bacteroidia bacterium]|nr:hypothetical protein [Bacteroidia bacterium]